MKSKWLSIICLLILKAGIVHAGEVSLTNHGSGIWSMADTADMHRWLVIHEPDRGRKTGIYHIEVIGRKKSDPAWKIIRLVNHMAITEQALKKSIVTPLDKGAVYPEAFQDALRQWQSLNNGKGGAVCRTSVTQCMKQ